MREPSLAEVIRTCPHLSQGVHRTDKRREEQKRKEQKKGCSPNSPSVFNPSVVEILPDEVDKTVSTVMHHLDAGLAMLDYNDHGRPWPPPRRSAVVALCSRYPADLCLKAAREAREIVQAQDRAPNITGLFEKKLRELAA